MRCAHCDEKLTWRAAWHRKTFISYGFLCPYCGNHSYWDLSSQPKWVLPLFMLFGVLYSGAGLMAIDTNYATSFIVLFAVSGLGLATVSGAGRYVQRHPPRLSRNNPLASYSTGALGPLVLLLFLVWFAVSHPFQAIAVVALSVGFVLLDSAGGAVGRRLRSRFGS